MTEQTTPPEPMAAVVLADQVQAFAASMDGVSKAGQAWLAGAETALRAVASAQ